MIRIYLLVASALGVGILYLLWQNAKSDAELYKQQAALNAATVEYVKRDAQRVNELTANRAKQTAKNERELRKQIAALKSEIKTDDQKYCYDVAVPDVANRLRDYANRANATADNPEGVD